VHLRDGGCAQRLALQIPEQLQRRAAEYGAYLRQQRLEGHRRHLVLQFLELGNPFRAEQVHPGGQHLAELDERRPGLGKRHPYPFRCGELRRLRVRRSAQHLPGALQQAG
jgi:hypothetical protein